MRDLWPPIRVRVCISQAWTEMAVFMFSDALVVAAPKCHRTPDAAHSSRSAPKSPKGTKGSSGPEV